MIEKCQMNGCKNEIGYFENIFGINHCDECERLLMTASKEKIDISLCKNKKELMELLKRLSTP